MFGFKNKYKKKYTEKKTYSKPVSRVDKIINILEAADRKDRADSSVDRPKRKYVKSNKHRRGNFQIGW
tara:strand:+ start:881 stop:1084 length:204 start_codon:yes stop_codon:yes gene_type:complete